MPRLKIETIGSGDQSWLGSAHGIGNCRTETLDVSTLTKATHYPDGFVKSGLPLAKVAGLMVPYNSAGADGSQNLVGFLFTDQSTDGTTDLPVPVLDHGRVKTAKLPVAFEAPAAAADKTTCVYI